MFLLLVVSNFDCTCKALDRTAGNSLIGCADYEFVDAGFVAAIEADRTLRLNQHIDKIAVDDSGFLAGNRQAPVGRKLQRIQS